MDTMAKHKKIYTSDQISFRDAEHYWWHFQAIHGGAASPIGHVIGWSFVDPSGNAKLKNLSNMSSFKNGDCGCSNSDLLLVARRNPGWIRIPPATRKGLSSSFPARAAT